MQTAASTTQLVSATFSDTPYDGGESSPRRTPGQLDTTPGSFYHHTHSDPFSPATPSSATAFVPRDASSPERSGHKQSRKARHPHFGRSSSSAKRYPKGEDEEEYREESLSLWSPTEEDEESEGSDPSIGGIRLVSSPRLR